MKVVVSVYGYGSFNPLLVVPYLYGWPKQGSKEFVFLHIYVRIFFYLADSSGQRYIYSRTFPDYACHLPELFWVKKLICQQNSGQPTFCAQLLPDKENFMSEFFQTFCLKLQDFLTIFAHSCYLCVVFSKTFQITKTFHVAMLQRYKGFLDWYCDMV